MAKIQLNPNNNSIITQSKTSPEWSSMSLGTQAYVSNNGIVQLVKVSGLLKAKTEVLEGMVEALGLKAGMEFPLAHTIVVSESHTPFYPGQSAKINPSKPNEIYLDETGQQVYRSTIVELKTGIPAYVWVGDKTPVVATVSESIEAFENA